jgi:ABC-2 type transport system ATP-binding protein
LAGVSFDLKAGELLALLGPNGAGKTTLVRAVSGRVVPDGGTICLLGTEIGKSGGREALGVVPQEIAIYPELTAKENLEVFGRLQGLSGAAVAERVSWALEWTGLSDRAHQQAKRFSGGMQRRVNIACGVLHRPKVLLLDEPTVGVDPQSRERIYEMLSEIRAGGTSILMTTHHLDEAEARCDRIVVIDQGQVAAEGTLAELIQQTVGAHRHVRLVLSKVPPSAIDGWELNHEARTISARLADVALGLPPVLEALRGMAIDVEDVAVRGPSLHAVFLHLTGKELRE